MVISPSKTVVLSTSTKSTSTSSLVGNRRVFSKNDDNDKYRNDNDSNVTASTNTGASSSVYDKKGKMTGSAPLIAGLFGGAASTLLLYPLDLVKVRLQVNEGNNHGTKKKSSNQKRVIVRTPQNRYLLWKQVRGIIRHEGIYGLYQGLSPALIGSAASWGGYFFLYESMKTKLREHKQHKGIQLQSQNLGHIENFSAACLSGAVMVLFTNPIWLIKTRMQLQLKNFQEQQQQSSLQNNAKTANLHIKVKPPYRNMLDAARTIVREEGPLALYNGSIPALMLVTHGGVQFVAYEFLKSIFGEYRKSSQLSLNKDGIAKDRIGINVMDSLRDSFGYLAMGASSKVLASTVTYPIQLIKSRLQQRSEAIEICASTGEIKVVKRHYNGVLDCASKIYKREGIFGFFKGCLPNAIRVAPGAAITFVVYESVMNMLQ